MEETTDPAFLEKAKGVLGEPTADRASFLLVLNPGSEWRVLVLLLEMLDLKDLTEPPAIAPMVSLAGGCLPSLLEELLLA